MKALVLSVVVFLYSGAWGVGVTQDTKEDGAILAKDAGEHVGETVAIEGRVFQTARTVGGVHLYFNPDFSSGFQALIASKFVHKFKVDPLVRYNKRNVRVTGKVQEENGRPYILVTNPKQLKVLPRKRKRPT
ncbi:MAG: hypothetical protein ACE5JI_11345 [Acidobacteriota bacterium]